MAKKKHLQGLSDEEMNYIDDRFNIQKPVSSDNEFYDDYKLHSLTFNFKLNIKCKNQKQKDFLNNLKDPAKIICFGTGSAGTGKSYISLSYALSKIKDGEFDKIIMVVPTAQASGKDMNIGLLPGTADDKTKPFKDVDRYTIEKILKSSDNYNYKQMATYLVNTGVIQYEFINFMLGKTFDNALILVNESEQYTKDDMKLIMTRIGENSKLIITGDDAQTNRTSIVSKKDMCGLTFVVERLKDMEEVGITEFSREDIVRNPIITKILDRFD